MKLQSNPQRPREQDSCVDLWLHTSGDIYGCIHNHWVKHISAEKDERNDGIIIQGYDNTHPLGVKIHQQIITNTEYIVIPESAFRTTLTIFNDTIPIKILTYPSGRYRLQLVITDHHVLIQHQHSNFSIRCDNRAKIMLKYYISS